MKKVEYLDFEEGHGLGKTRVVNVLSKSSGDLLGVIRWYTAWRQYCFYPQTDCVFNFSCLTDIATFAWNMNMAHKTA